MADRSAPRRDDSWRGDDVDRLSRLLPKALGAAAEAERTVDDLTRLAHDLLREQGQGGRRR